MISFFKLKLRTRNLLSVPTSYFRSQRVWHVSGDRVVCVQTPDEKQARKLLLCIITPQLILVTWGGGNRPFSHLILQFFTPFCQGNLQRKYFQAVTHAQSVIESDSDLAPLGLGCVVYHTFSLETQPAPASLR